MTVVGHLLGLPWAVAAVLGAVVSPPDPVAATAVAGRLRLPTRLVTVLEGEGQFNDATALVLYQLSVMAVVAGGVTVAEVGLGLVVAVVGGTSIGFAGGWLARRGLDLLHDPAAETTVTLAVPFALYLVADELGASGVLAVLVAGLYLRATMSGELPRRLDAGSFRLGVRRVHDQRPAVRLPRHGTHERAAERVRVGGRRHSRIAGAVIGVLVASRALAMYTASAVMGRRARRTGVAVPYGWRESAVTSWAGMRGVVTVATALALPVIVEDGSAFPSRRVVVVVALLVVIVTLVLQGLTLAPLIRRLGVGKEEDRPAEVRDLGRRAAEAALEQVRRASDVPEEVRAAVARPVREPAERPWTHAGPRRGRPTARWTGEALRSLLARASEAEREVVLDARRSGAVSPATADHVLYDIEVRARRFGW